MVQYLMATYVDAAGALKAWINSRPALVGAGAPLQKGAHLHYVGGATPATYAYLEELPGRPSDDSSENPDMLATISCQVIGGTREAVALAATALAEALVGLSGRPVDVPGARLWVGDEIQGPTWSPDGNLPRMIVQATIRMSPA